MDIKGIWLNKIFNLNPLAYRFVASFVLEAGEYQKGSLQTSKERPKIRRRY
jgi:hypothetical protein